MAFNNDTHLEAKFLQIKEQYGIKSVIETGTFYADTTKWLSDNFDKVYTCEVNAQYFKIGQEQLVGRTNVVSCLQDSREFLIEALKQAEGPVLIFLDAHWGENPLLREIEIIGESGVNPIVAIHDFKVPGKNFGYDTYPGIVYDWDFIKESVGKAFDNQYTTEYNEVATGAKRGCIFIYPNAATHAQSLPEGTGSL
jgi:hypothetical protein